MDIVLMMYTRNNPSCAEPLFEQNNSLNVNFNTSKKTVWIIHGYRPMGSTPKWLQNFLKVLLNHEDLNVIVVDWNRGATTFIYNRAVKNIRKVAATLGTYIQVLLNHGATLDNFHFIGMSLGAHVSGFVGKIFQGQLGRITGLDPAGPKFSGQPCDLRLDYTDAKFVDVIHSDINDFHAGSCVDCDDFKEKSCPRLGYQAELWKDVLKERKEKRFLRTTVFLDTTGTKPFCSYYFVLSITVLDNNMKNGCITFKLLNQLGMVEESRVYEKNRSFYQLQEVKILAQFSNDVVNISGIGLGYFQSSNWQCFQCNYNIHRVMVQSLTYPERPPLCIYNFVLKGNEELFLNPSTCTSGFGL
ncbi:lipase member I isoform X4 [Herpailurus yagouaroundi]|uniref:lipase member I isoform X4 n=1 Tax=Herpailurus yagouaroundi TaxID=1608482 RepID=UPI001AD7160B|nr:lipase member I isoform X4 [Puma yagouaroundi]